MRFYISGGRESAEKMAEIGEMLARNGHIVTVPASPGGSYDALFEAAYKWLQHVLRS